MDKLRSKAHESDELPQAAPLPKPEKHPKTGRHVKPPDPLLDATQQDLAEYLRGKLIALSPSDGINDNLEVHFDSPTSTLTISQPGSRCEHFLNALDTNNIYWDVFDPSDAYNSREPILRLTATTVSGKRARACYDTKGHPEYGLNTNRVRLLFSYPKSEQVSGFQDKMMKVMKKLIVMSGGSPENDIFHPPSSSVTSGHR
ncbi:MAG: hypothetical protein ABSD72_03690 [Terracidiphilus sp.]|jgi:hypothetical protein